MGQPYSTSKAERLAHGGDGARGIAPASGALEEAGVRMKSRSPWNLADTTSYLPPMRKWKWPGNTVWKRPGNTLWKRPVNTFITILLVGQIPNAPEPHGGPFLYSMTTNCKHIRAPITPDIVSPDDLSYCRFLSTSVQISSGEEQPQPLDVWY